MSAGVSEGVRQKGKLLVHVAENGRSFEFNCDGYTLVEVVQRHLESFTGIRPNDQLLLCLDLRLNSQQPLSAYKLPADDREVFLFNRARMKSNSLPPDPEQIEVVENPDPPSPTSSNGSHPLDGASDPAMKALPSYERQFRYHFQRGEAIYNRTLSKYETCTRLSREQRVQEKAIDVARGNLNHFYKMILQNYVDFSKCYSQQQRAHNNLLVNFWRDIERLKSVKIIPALQTDNRKCLLDFVKEENFTKIVDECSKSHMQFENKVGELRHEFEELKVGTEHLFSSKASILHADLERTIKEHQQYISEQRSIMQTLSKDVGMVKKLVDDCLSSQLSSSLRPHDAVSALGPMYESHDKTYLPKMHASELAISNLLVFCKNKKTEMNSFVHWHMQQIAYIQYTIKEVHYKFSAFTEALKRQNDQFAHLKVVRGIGPAYRACLAEIVRRKASVKLYMGMAGQLAESLASKREAEVKRREEFLKVHSSYIPRDILASMGLYDFPSQCDVNIPPFDNNLLDIDISDVDRYAPEHLVGLSSKHGKSNSSKSSVSMSSDGARSGLVEQGSVNTSGKDESEFILEVSELAEIAGTNKMEVENAKLKAELASSIAMLCSLFPELENEPIDDSKVDNVLKDAANKTAEALRLKDEYGKRLESLLKSKQMQCESYEKRIRELEQMLSDQYSIAQKLNNGESAFGISTEKVDDIKSGISADGETHLSYMCSEQEGEVSGFSSSVHVKILGALDKQRKDTEGLDDNMTDSGILNPQLDSSMLESNRDEGHVSEKDSKDTTLADGGMVLATSSSALLSDSSANKDLLDGKAGVDIVLELKSVLAEKSAQLSENETKREAMREEIAKLRRELEINGKLLDESQLNCAHLENCLHEAREEAQTHLCAAERRASEYRALRISVVKLRSLFERLKSCVSSGGVAAFAESLHALAQSFSKSTNDSEDESTGEFRECVKVLAEKVGVLARHRSELLDRYSKALAANEQLTKQLEEQKELVNTLYTKHQVEKQTNKEKISFNRLEVHELAAFVLNTAGHYEAISRNCTHYYLSAESVALFVDHLPHRPPYIVGQIVHIERQTVKPLPFTSAQTPAVETNQFPLNSGSTYGLPIGSEYFIVTVAMLPDTAIQSPQPSGSL